MSIADNFKNIYKEIEDAARKCGRDPQDINLVAVSKRQSDDRIKAALSAGHRVFGENKVQQAGAHWKDIKEEYPDLRLHLIGPLQSNKIKDAVRIFDCIETIDREKIAQKLADEMANQNKDLPCFIQVNTGEEEQKSGILPAYISEFHDYCRYDCGLDIKGLMCIPPVDDLPALHFAFLKKLSEELGLSDLSMGMSADYLKAIPLGATYIRVGTALFGEREQD